MKQKIDYRHYVLAILLIVYCFNFLDRQILAILSPQIRKELGLSDTQLGTLKGFAFALLYAGMGIPLAVLADRTRRTRLIACALATWSLMTALCGMGHSFTQLLLARVGVGIGEAGGAPPSHALLSDYFSREERATALGIYSLGVPIGTVVGFLIGGWLLEHLGWRLAFVCVGLPGVPLAALLYLTVREPVRGATEPAAPSPSRSPEVTLRDVFRSPIFLVNLAAGSLTAFTGYSLSLWLVDFYVRVHALTPGRTAMPMAIAAGVGGGLGALLGGYLTDKAAKSRRSLYLAIPGVALLIAAPALYLTLTAEQLSLSFTALAVTFGLIYVPLGPLYGVLQTSTPVQNRTLVTSIYFFGQSFLGAGLGPFLIGFISDRLRAGLDEGAALRTALFILVPITAATGLLLLLARRVADQKVRETTNPSFTAAQKFPPVGANAD